MHPHKIDHNTFYRQENNGLTIYHLTENEYQFFKGLFLSEGASGFNSIDFSQYSSSTEIDLEYPLCVCCLVENTCNLNCIYCFGDDKMYDHKIDQSVDSIYRPLVNMNPLQISLGGGEPTLNPHLGDIIEYIAKKDIAVIVDTNGTTNSFIHLLPAFKKNDVLVRFSIDSFDDDVIQQVRPYKYYSNKSISRTIRNNIDLLINNGINVSVQTVLTNRNINNINEIAEYLVRKGIKRWHLAAVKYSVKCKDVYNSIKIDDSMFESCIDILKCYKEKIHITVANEKDYGPNARLFFDVNGDFLTDSIINGLNYLGREPSLDHLFKYLDSEAHIKRYLGDFYIYDFNSH